MDDGDIAGIPEGDEEVDEVRLDAGKTIESSACSISSRRGGRRRLETVPGSWALRLCMGPSIGYISELMESIKRWARSR
jgi:hypothetical protein